MAGTLNKVMLIGHTGDDVKMKYFEGGGCVGNFPLATNEEYINKSTGEKVSNTEWHNIVVRNKAAEVCEKYLKKGDKVYIEGRIKTRKWQDDKGMDRYITEIQCLEFTFLTPKDSGMAAGGNNAPTSTPQSNSKPSPATPQATEEEEDDLPF
jgi:single-strand DNA-binding protein